MTRFADIFPGHKPIIAMAHVPPLPGTPLYDESRGVDGLVEAVRADLRILLDAEITLERHDEHDLRSAIRRVYAQDEVTAEGSQFLEAVGFDQVSQEDGAGATSDDDAHEDRITPRIDAGDRFSPEAAAIVFDPTGMPLST